MKKICTKDEYVPSTKRKQGTGINFRILNGRNKIKAHCHCFALMKKRRGNHLPTAKVKDFAVNYDLFFIF